MRFVDRSLPIAAVFWCLYVHVANAQVDVQKFQLQKLSFQYQSSNSDTRNRCLNWLPLQDESPVLEYNDGEPFLRVTVKARLAKGCQFTVRPERTLKRLPSEGGEVAFEALIKPPVTVAYLQGDNFEDTLVFEAPVTRLNDISFFSFFRKSRVAFDGRYTTLTTNNTDIAEENLRSTRVLPVFGGNIYFPIPWTDYVGLGFAMYQNLGNITSSSLVKVQYSEMVFSLRGQWRGKESWGRPEVAGVVDYRSRNLYQDTSLTAGEKPFVFGATALPGFGIDASWFFGAAFAPWESPASRFGIDFSGRFSVGTVDGAKLTSLMIDTALNYRITRKWAIGLGYSFASQKADNVPDKDTGISEKFQNFFLRLTLIPYLGDEWEG